MTRSRTGCITCRSRKLKCDEVKPECGQCKKASRECRPSDGVVFRHQQNASMNGAGEVQTRGGNGRLGAFYAYRNTFNENNVWVEVPKNVTFLNITDPYNMDATPEPEYRTPTPLIVSQLEERHEENLYRLPYDQAPGLEALSAAAINDYQYLRPVSMHPHTPQETSASPHSSNNLNFILNPTERSLATPPIDPALSSPATISTRRESITVTEHEVAFLLRHFSEMCGQWMDLFDLGGYFAHHVPVQAMTNPLLRYAACAYAAKQLGRVRGRKATIGGIVDQPADMEVFSNPEKVDWLYLGAKYYDRAISLLMVELANPHSNNELPATPAFVEDAFSPQGSINSPHSSVTETRGNKRRRVSRQTNTNNVDETLAAAAILCVYEFLDMASGAWSRHLSGTKSLFDLADKQGMIAVRSPSSPGTFSQRVPPSRGRRATFWCFARQDCLAALINESQTRLNTEDFRLWKAAGLQLDEQGFVLPSNVEESSDGQPPMREDMISNALIWLMSKIINFIAVGDSVDNVYPQDPTSETAVYGINQMTLLERWRELEKELDIWHQGLPDTFKACARLPPVTNGSVSPDSPRSMFSEIWYSLPMCGSTMQSYHMARTILLINKPHESSARQSTLTTRLNSYRAIEMEVRHHSHEVIGIALGRPEASVRIHQVQPLFVAGQCLTDRRERRVILDLLKGIEADLGWATDYRVKQLRKEWDWAPET